VFTKIWQNDSERREEGEGKDNICGPAENNESADCVYQMVYLYFHFI
jgi:hypothetical protein